MKDLKSIILLILFGVALLVLFSCAIFLGVKIGTEHVRNGNELVIMGVQDECYQGK